MSCLRVLNVNAGSLTWKFLLQLFLRNYANANTQFVNKCKIITA